MRLELPPPDRPTIEARLVESARQEFGSGDGILRIEWSRPGEAHAKPELIVVPRAVGPEPSHWRAADSAAVHPGPGDRHNTKFVDVSAYDQAREEVRGSDLDEMLIYDAEGHLVEGGRSNFLVVTESGRIVTPDLALGAVEGLGLTIVRENRPEISFARLTRADVAAARELMSVNVVRGVVPILERNGQPVGDGRAGPWSKRLRGIFGLG